MKVPEVNEVIGHEEIHTNMAKHCSEYQNSLQWRHNGCYGVSNHQPRDCLLKRSFRRRSKKTSKLRVTGLCVGNSPVTGEFPAQMTSNAENVSTDGMMDGKWFTISMFPLDLVCKNVGKMMFQNLHSIFTHFSNMHNTKKMPVLINVFCQIEMIRFDALMKKLPRSAF